MIEILPALPVEEKPIDPRDQIIDLVAMKQHDEWFNTWCTREQYETYHFGGLSFEQKHDMARQWSQQRDHAFDTGRGDYFV
jgi:hypothetical protein